jgi:sigma-E factor negative regulatory protein RseB
VTGSASEEHEKVMQLLGSMVKAIKTLNYQGTLVYMNNGDLETIKVYHAVKGQIEHERLIQLNGSSREILHYNETATCILPDTASVVVGKRHSGGYLSPLLRGDIQAFKDYYRFLVQGNERIAGKQTTIVAVEPKDIYRYGHRLWLDSSNGLLLKSTLVDENKKLIEQMMFTEINVVDSVSDELLSSSIDTRKFKWYRDGEAEQITVDDDKRWHIEKMPRGFHLIGYHKRQTSHGGNPADHILLTDGLASVSVFIERLEPKMQEREGLTRTGAMNAYATVREGYQIIVVGAVPQGTASMIAKSTRPPNE